MQMINHPKTILFSLFFLWLFSTPVYSTEYESNVIVATDFSSSYFVKERFKNIEKNFKTLRKTVASKNSGPNKPLLFQVIPIDELSQAKGTVCEYTLQEKKLFAGVDDGCDGEAQCSADIRDFKTFVNDICVKSVLKREQGGGTDIEGALSLAGQLSTAQRATNTFLFIFSDMAEYRFENVISTPPNLEGISVVVVCGGISIGDGFCMSQEEMWSKKLQGYGAETVTFVVESSSWQNVARDLFE